LAKDPPEIALVMMMTSSAVVVDNWGTVELGTSVVSVDDVMVRLSKFIWLAVELSETSIVAADDVTEWLLAVARLLGLQGPPAESPTRARLTRVILDCITTQVSKDNHKTSLNTKTE
jgi:hypothetical protein